MQPALSYEPCIHPNRWGMRCRARPLSDSEYCYQHDPRKKDERALRNRFGAARKHQKHAERKKNEPKGNPDAPAMSLRNIGECLTEIERIGTAMRRGESTERRARVELEAVKIAGSLLVPHEVERLARELGLK